MSTMLDKLNESKDIDQIIELLEDIDEDFLEIINEVYELFKPKIVDFDPDEIHEVSFETIDEGKNIYKRIIFDYGSVEYENIDFIKFKDKLINHIKDNFPEELEREYYDES